MKRIECPGCRVSYPDSQMFHHPGDRPASGKTYTVVCSVCGHQFDVRLRDGIWRRVLAAIRG